MYFFGDEGIRRLARNQTTAWTGKSAQTVKPNVLAIALDSAVAISFATNFSL
jgi:hypothetical protein